MVFATHQRMRAKGTSWDGPSQMDNGLLASPQLSRLQESLDILTGIFYRVSMRKNLENTVGMLCQMFCYAGSQSTEAYNRCITGDGRIN